MDDFSPWASLVSSQARVDPSPAGHAGRLSADLQDFYLCAAFSSWIQVIMAWSSRNGKPKDSGFVKLNVCTKTWGQPVRRELEFGVGLLVVSSPTVLASKERSLETETVKQHS